MKDWTEGVNGLPQPLVEALVKAKEWRDRQPRAATGIRAGLEQEDWDREAVALLEDIVESVDSTWGYA